MCPTTRNCIAVGFYIMTSANGGATWTERTKAADIGIACRTSTDCLVSGEQNTATRDGGKTWTVPMKKYTSDGGKTWMNLPPHILRRVSAVQMRAAAVSC